MARLFTSGFEAGSLTDGMEWTTIASTPTLSTTTVRSGTYSLRISSLGSTTRQGHRYQFASANGNGPYYFRFYIRYATLPSADNTICEVLSTAPSMMVRLFLKSDGTLQLGDEDGTIGSPSSALISSSFENCVEIKIDRTGAGGAHVVEAKLNGTVFATASNRNLSAGVALFRLGGNLGAEAQTQGDWFFDDVAINDSTGSYQTSYPGSGKVILLVPNADGDATVWRDTTNTTVGTNNWQLVDEVPPNDATDFVQHASSGIIDMYNMSASGIGASDIVSLVSTLVRFRNNTADATAAFRVRIEKAASGTVSESSNIVPNSTTWRSNAPAAPATSSLTLYQDPDSANWTKTTLDSMQAGLNLSVAGTQRIQVSALYVFVEYIPAGWKIFGDQQFVS